jgi:hypothetical protein
MCRTRHDGNLCPSSIFSGASEWTTTLARPNYRRHLERSSARRFRHKRATCKCVRLLLLKLVQVLVAAEVGGHNRFVEMPRLSVSLKRACRHRQCASSTLCRRVAYRIGSAGRSTRRCCSSCFQSTARYAVVRSAAFVSHVHADGHRRRVNRGSILPRLTLGKGHLLLDPTACRVLFSSPRVVSGIHGWFDEHVVQLTKK